jgi:alpha/beta superfamily hydrolase
MEERPIYFESDGLKLEGRLFVPETGFVHAAIICHPHPLYGGSMDNNVVAAILRAMWPLGWATLRFNFRGVGLSEGKHGGGVAEQEDVKAAAAYLSSETALKSVVLAGYSFGARMVLGAAPEIPGTPAVVAVAPPVSTPLGAPPMSGFGGKVILIAGDRDSFCSAADLEHLHAAGGEKSSMTIISGANHFFGGFELELERLLREALRTI